MIKILNIKDRKDLFEKAVDYYWEQWGSSSNRNFYKDCMYHSCQTDNKLPNFYIAIQSDIIVGSYALLSSDLNSRQDLKPWFACLFVSPELRGKNIGFTLQKHAIEQANLLGYQQLYLCTELEGYYERNNWNYIGDGYIFNGDITRIYKTGVN
jgi:predicted GNAT superfamily acetyltransferase